MKKHKIIDTIFLYDEIDMLLFRFTELNEYVDHFIVMESNIDFLGNLKPFFFLENRLSLVCHYAPVSVASANNQMRPNT